MDERRFKVGELARATGLSVRALRHYDELGLLVPSERTGGGHRLYGEDDVHRLYRIVALRSLGLSLEEVRAALEAEGPDVRVTLRRHLERLDEEIAERRRLRRRVARILGALGDGGAPVTEFIETIERMTMTERYYTPEQLEQLERRRQELGEEGMAKAQQEWAGLIAAVRAEQEAGTDPGHPRVQELARRWRALIERFTGGDPGIRASLQRMYEEQGPERASRGMVDPELMAYIGRAQAALDAE